MCPIASFLSFLCGAFIICGSVNQSQSLMTIDILIWEASSYRVVELLDRRLLVFVNYEKSIKIENIIIYT